MKDSERAVHRRMGDHEYFLHKDDMRVVALRAE